MGQASYTPEQEVALWKSVIRHAIIRIERRHRRWTQEELTLNSVTDSGDEVGDLIPAEDWGKPFQNMELKCLLSALPQRERFVIEAIYICGHTQREVASKMLLSQSKVNQLHKRALKRLKGMVTDEMHSTRGS